jgi:hypothetical protein
MNIKLAIFLRTCTRRGVSETPLNRWPGDTRVEMVKKCVSSLIRSAGELVTHHKIPVHVEVIDDHSDPEFLEWVDMTCWFMRTTQLRDGITYNIQNCGDTGFNQSAKAQFEAASKSDATIIYLVEDDYYHVHNALELMLMGLRTASSVLPKQQHAAFFPYDCPDRYLRDEPSPCKIFYDPMGSLYYRTVDKTSNTVMMYKSTFDLMYDDFIKLGVEYQLAGNVSEDNTINPYYNNGVTAGGPVVLMSPIPSVALHIEEHPPLTITESLTSLHQQYVDDKIT